MSAGTPDILFTSLLGDQFKGQATSNLLKVGNISLLLDCGIDEAFSQASLLAIEQAIYKH